MNRLLLPEKPIAVLPSLAAAVGLNGAVALQQLHYWLGGIDGGNKYGRQKDGKPWIYNNYDEWKASNFPFWSVSTIRRIFATLEKDELIITEIEYDHDFPGGKRKWYTIDYDKVSLIGCAQVEHTLAPSVQNEQTGVSNMNTPSVQNEQTIYIESENTTETTPETTEDQKTPAASPDGDPQPIIQADPPAPIIATPEPDQAIPDKPKPVQPYIAIIDAWYEGMPAPPTTRKYPRNVACAKRIQEAGYTPIQVKAFVQDRYEQPYWRDRNLPLETVENDLPLWVKEHHVPADPVRAKLIVPEVDRRAVYERNLELGAEYVRRKAAGQ